MWHSFHTSKMTGTHQKKLIDHLSVLLFFIELNLFLYVVISTQTEDSITQHLPSQHHHHPHHPEGEENHRIPLSKLITTAIPVYRNFTRMQPAFFYLIEEIITLPPQEVNHQLQEATGSRVESSSYFETIIHKGKLHLTAIPVEGWKNNHLQICSPSLPSHFERISTRVSGVPQ